MRIQDLPFSNIAHELVGADHDVDACVIFVDAPPGRGPSLHTHPYAEIFIIQEGEGAFIVGDERREAGAGEVAHRPAGHAARLHEHRRDATCARSTSTSAGASRPNGSSPARQRGALSRGEADVGLRGDQQGRAGPGRRPGGAVGVVRVVDPGQRDGPGRRTP